MLIPKTESKITSGIHSKNGIHYSGKINLKIWSGMYRKFLQLLFIYHWIRFCNLTKRSINQKRVFVNMQKRYTDPKSLSVENLQLWKVYVLYFTRKIFQCWWGQQFLAKLYEKFSVTTSYTSMTHINCKQKSHFYTRNSKLIPKSKSHTFILFLLTTN